MKLELHQTWLSESHPYESFVIYDGIADSFVLSDMEIYDDPEFEELPETAKIFFWKRYDKWAFHDFIVSKKGNDYDTTYPYASCGESKKAALVKKIKKYNMHLA